jgi:N-acetylneuraminic acid mutarotase
MNQQRGDHTATLLADGKVLVVGGIGPVPGMALEFKAALSNAELYDPASGTWTQLASQMATERYYHTATLLPDGKVLIAGGLTTDQRRIIGRSSTELYDPEYQKDAEKTSPLR